MSVCRSCGAPIFWVRSQSGKPMPLDLDATVDGNVTVEDGVARVRVGVDRDVELARAGVLYTAHFVTCPHADQWRRR